MKEVDNRPICAFCGKIHEGDFCYDWRRNYSYQEIVSGCSVCGQSLVLATDRNKVCCSNPKCPAWTVYKNGEVYYGDRLIFSASWEARKIIAYSGFDFSEDKDQFGQNKFYKKLFNSIIKEKSKSPSNIYKGLRFIVK